MTLADLDRVASAGRFPFQLSDRLAVVILEPVPDVVIVGHFFVKIVERIDRINALGPRTAMGRHSPGIATLTVTAKRFR